jgi:hypothetical protein
MKIHRGTSALHGYDRKIGEGEDITIRRSRDIVLWGNRRLLRAARRLSRA